MHDARAALQSVIAKSAVALRNLLDTWESQYESRCRFLHVLESNSQLRDIFGVDSAQRNRLLPIIDTFALVLQQPRDVGAAVATAALTQRRKKQLEYVSKRHNSALTTRNRTLFDALNLPNTEAAFIALSLFAEFWTDELVTLTASQSSDSARITMVMQPASARALRRLALCAEFILETTKRIDVGFFEAGDVALAATQAGRDAKLVGARLHALFDFSPQTHSVSETKELTLRIRSISQTMRTMATTFSSKLPTSLPSEPLQSLFMHPTSGERAVARVRLVLERFNTLSDASKALIESAVAASYASNLLGGSGDPVDVRSLLVGTVSPTVDDAILRSIFVKRAAALRLDVSVDEAEAATSVEDLTTRLSGVAISNAPTSMGDTPTVFYVPHGYGDAPPPLTQPSMSSPMFGSVPVYTARLVTALDLIISTLRGITDFNEQPVATLAPGVTVVDFVFWPCENYEALEGSELGPTEHPFFIRTTSKTISVFASRGPAPADDDEDEQLVSLPELAVFGPSPAQPAAVPTIPAVQTKAESFKLNKKSLDLSSMISSVAWNAERVLQASCLAGAARADGAQLFLAFDFKTRPYVASRPAAIRSRRSLLQIQARARAFARNHVQRIRDIFAEVRGDLQRQVQAAEERQRQADGEALPQGVFDDGDGGFGTPGEVPAQDEGDDEFEAPVPGNQAIFSFGVDFDGVDVDGVDAPASPDFVPGSPVVLQKLMGTQRLTQGELDKWIDDPRGFGEAAFAAFPFTPWEGIPSAMNYRQRVAFDKYNVSAENTSAQRRLNELVIAIESEKDQFNEQLIALRTTTDEETEQRHLKLSRLGLAASSAIGIAMASTSMSAPTVDALFRLGAILGLRSPSERNEAVRTLSRVRNALDNAEEVDALRLSEVCALFATAMTDPSVGDGQEDDDDDDDDDGDEFPGYEYVTGSEESVKSAFTVVERALNSYLAAPRLTSAQFTIMRARMQYVDLDAALSSTRPSFIEAPLERLRTIATSRSSVELALQRAEPDFPAARFQPVVGSQRAATAIMTATALLVHRSDAITLGRMAFASTAIGGVALQPEFQKLARSRPLVNAAWFRSPSKWVVSLADGSASFTLSNVDVLTSLVTLSVHKAYSTLTTAELNQLQSASASLLLADRVSAVDRALEAGTYASKDLDELCDNFLDAPTKALCDILNDAGFTRVVDAETNRPVYELPEERTDAGEVVVRLPGELANFVDFYRGRPQVVSNALCTLFNLPPQVQWTFNGDVATRPLETPQQLTAFQTVRAFVMKNMTLIAVAGRVSASLALASMMSSMYNVHPATIMSTDDALGLASQQPGAENPIAGWLPRSITVNLEGDASQFVVAFGPLRATFGMGSPWDRIPSIQVQPPIPQAVVQEGSAAVSTVLARQQDTYAEYPILNGISDVLVWMFMQSFN